MSIGTGKGAFSERQVDRLVLLGLLVAALVLYGINLGKLPLRDWDEGTVAQVARDIWRAPAGSLTWLYPSIGGAPYFSKPPLMHWLIALAFKLGGVNEWTARLPGATLTALSVPLLYSVGRELLPRRTAALFAALIYLTLLPVVRNGRLAMLDGAVLCFFLLMVVCLLRSRRDLRWGLGTGIAFGLIFLTKGILALLLGAIVCVFVLLDTPRLLTSGYIWGGVLLGSAPVVAWYGTQWLHYGTQFVNANLISQSFDRVLVPVEGNRGAVWYYLLEILKYSLPWLLLLPQGFRLAWENRNLSWAKLVLVWSGYLLVISLMSTKLPWYVLPLYPALAIVGGVQLAQMWHSANGLRGQANRRYPLIWTGGLGLLAIAAWIASFYFSGVSSTQPTLQLILTALALTLTLTAVLLPRDAQFIWVLIWGCYVSLTLLMASNYWNWELDEAYPVKPVAEIIQRSTPANQTIWTSYPYYRPSLNFYSDRTVVPASATELQSHWQQDHDPYLLIEPTMVQALSLKSAHLIDQAEGWVLVTRTQAQK